MAFEIEWSEPALQDLKVIDDYLKTEWSDTVADKFIEQIQEKIRTLSKYPLMGMVSGKIASVRSIKLSKYNKLYYRINNDTLVLLSIFDTRQNPDKNIYR